MPSWKWLLSMAFWMFACHFAVAQQDQSGDLVERLVRGKTLQDWMLQVAEGPRLQDREHALQVLRSDGLRLEREKTLAVFATALSSDEATVQSLAAAGLKKAGLPTNPEALVGLVRILSEDLSGARPAEVSPDSEKLPDRHVRFTMLIRVIRTLEVLGDHRHTPLLEKIGANHKVHAMIRQAANLANRKIKARLSENRPGQEKDEDRDQGALPEKIKVQSSVAVSRNRRAN